MERSPRLLALPGSSVFAMFDAPLPEGMEVDDSVRGGALNATVVELGEGLHYPSQKIPVPRIPEYGAFPCALTPDKPLATIEHIDAALKEIAQRVGATVPVLPERSGIDIL